MSTITTTKDIITADTTTIITTRAPSLRGRVTTVLLPRGPIMGLARGRALRAIEALGLWFMSGRARDMLLGVKNGMAAQAEGSVG